MNLRAVIFDLGHTIWDYAPSESARRLTVLRLHQRLEASLGGGRPPPVPVRRLHQRRESSLGDDVPPPAALDRALGAAAERWFEYWRSDRREQPPSEELIRAGLLAV